MGPACPEISGFLFPEKCFCFFENLDELSKKQVDLKVHGVHENVHVWGCPDVLRPEIAIALGCEKRLDACLCRKVLLDGGRPVGVRIPHPPPV